jgi:DNA-binding response OmpR family regulator
MSSANVPSPLRFCLVCDDAIMEAAVRVSCPPPHQVDVFSAARLLNAQHTLSDHGAAIVEAASSSQTLLINWDFDDAPAINTLCFHLRRSVAVPIFMLCRGDQETMAACIAAGADDALTFPLYLPYVEAKVLSYHRLVKAAQDAVVAPNPTAVTGTNKHTLYHFGDLKLDHTAHRFFIRNTEVPLTPREFALLHFLIEHQDALCTREQILDHVWGITFDTGTNMVDVYMYFLRKKLEAHGLKNMIETVRGQGYRLVLPEAEATQKSPGP